MTKHCRPDRPAARPVSRGALAGVSLASLLLLSSFGVAAQGLKPSTQLRTPSTSLGGNTPAGSSGGTPAAQRQADFIVAVVNSDPITNNEVRARLLRAEQQLTQQGAPLPPRREMVAQVLERLISDKAQLQLARQSGIRVDENAIDNAQLAVARQNQVTVEELRRRLVADGISYTQFRADLSDEIMVSRLRQREVEPRVTVTEQEIDQFLREQDGGGDPSALELNLAQILIAVPENASPQQVATLQATAQRAATRAREGADFAALVTEYSQAPDRQPGGQLGLRGADRYPPLFVDATQNLRSGDIAGPVRSGAGFHVLKVIEKKQAGTPSASINQTRARHILLRVTPQLTEQAAIARLADMKKRILAGQADFAALARENSEDGSAKEGGDLGWANPGMFVPEFEQAMDRLAPGQISDPLISRFGVHLIQVNERRENKLSSREQRELARNALREKKLQEAYALWAQEVRGRAYVEYREPPQ